MEFGYFLQDLMARGQTSFLAENWEATVKYFEALATALPEVARAHSTLCVAYAKLGKIDVAAAYCAKATTLEGAKVIDHLRFIDLTLRKDKLTPSDARQVDDSLNHLRAHAAQFPQARPGDTPKPASIGTAPETGDQLMAKMVAERRAARAGGAGAPGNDVAPVDVVAEAKPMHLPTEIELRACKLATLVGDDARLQTCVAALQGLKVDSRLLLPFIWARALLHHDEPAAQKILQDAKQLGLPDSVIGSMERDQNRAFGRTSRVLLWLLVAAAAAGLAAYALRRRKASQAAVLPTTGSPATDPVQEGHSSVQSAESVPHHPASSG
jgi:hypothetical protein